MNLVFDIGGVIVDDSDETLKEFLGLSANEFGELKQVVYHDRRWSDQVMLGYLTQEEYAKELIAEHPEWKSEAEKCLLPKYQPRVLPILQENLNYIRELKKSGKYNLYVLSNLTSTTYEYLKEILRMFDGGVYSFREHVKKPDSRFYRTLFSEYKISPEECLFFDDRQRNIEAGEALGMRGIVVKTLEDIKSALSS